MIDIWQEIYATISRNKLRTFLTGFAVAWGIFMLIVLLGSGNGLINAFSSYSESMAMNSIKVFNGRTSVPYDGLKENRWIQLENSDLELTRTSFPETILDVGATVYQSNIVLSRGKEYINMSIYGVYPNYIEVETTNLAKGRFVNQLDIRERRKVIIIHEKAAEILFPGKPESAIGQFVNAGKVAYQIVGFYNDPYDQDTRYAYIPFTTLQTIYNKGNRLNNISFTTKGLETLEDNEAFESEYRKVIGNNRRFDPNDRSAIWIWNRFTDYMRNMSAMNVLTIAIWVIGIFTLLSGIVGVSNIMLITVKERTREFGIRKALGAKPWSILNLIIIESIVITTLFGYIGMVAGIGFTEYMDATIGNQTVDTGMWQETLFTNPTVSIHVAIQATVTLIIAGTVAGFFPARKATRIRPIEALRAD